jgi:hypothetical protein
MKNIFYVFLLMFALSACSSMTSIYFMSTGKIEVPKKESYQVIYRAGFGDQLTADVSYTDENGKKTSLKAVGGAWEKTVILKAGTRVSFKAIATSKTKSKAEYKILVDGKTVSEHVLNGKKLKYKYAFDLP